MQLNYSNHQLWMVLCMVSVVVALSFVAFGALMLHVWIMSLLMWMVAAWLFVWAYRLFFQAEQRYIDISEGQMVIRGAFIRQSRVVDLKEIKHVQLLSHTLQLITSGAQIISIRLNYLSSDDIKRLLLYFKYVPSVSKKMI